MEVDRIHLIFEMEMSVGEISSPVDINRIENQSSSVSPDTETWENGAIKLQESPDLHGISEEKADFIRWILPQIHRAREEIGHLMTTALPNSLIIAQAALESGWGKSFGAKNRQNLFGLTRKNGKYMEFDSSLDGLKKYISTLDRHPAYRGFRIQLGKTTNSLELTKHLTGYSVSPEYSDKLNKIIRKNRLTELDR